MRVTNKMMYGNYVSNLMRRESEIQRLSNQISSGKRIQFPSDDPIGTSRSMAMNSSLNDIAQYTTNSNSGISWLTATDEAMQTANTYLQRVYELILSGASSSMPAESRAALAAEIDQICDGLFEVANTNIDNRYIFSGTDVLQPAYTKRATVAGQALDLMVKPVVIDQTNSQIEVKLDDGPAKILNLTPGVYDGSTGKTLNDLANDIQKQLNAAGYDVPVYAKMTPDNQLALYAGTQPSDGKVHSLVLRNGPAIKTAGTVPATVGSANQMQLTLNSNNTADYYNGWTVTIVRGAGAGQSRQITDYDGATQRITGMNSDWLISPDTTSEYVLTPPLSGTAAGVGANTISFDPANASAIDDFYTGMTITITNGAGAGQTMTITGYDAATHTATLNPAWGTLPVGAEYTITPSLSGSAQSGANAPAAITLATAGSSSIDNFYNGTSITVTHANGSTETRRIIGYDGTTKQALLDKDWNVVPAAGDTYRINDSTLQKLGFEDKATTKELVGNPLTGPILVFGSYPLRANAQVPTGPPLAADQINLARESSTTANYYQNWTLTITSGAGAGQTRTISNYPANSQIATVDSPWTPAPDATSVYTLSPPTQGTVGGTTAANQIQLAANSALATDFYKGMPISISSGAGEGQSRTIIAYDPVTQIATLDSPWNVTPDATSQYSINANYAVNANNRFQITVGFGTAQEISLDGGSYTLEEFAAQIQGKIQALGGSYANVQTEITTDNRLRLVYHDPTDQDNVLPITLQSGSSADILRAMGFANGAKSEQTLPNYEGDQGNIEYEVNIGIRVKMNTTGDSLFDSIFSNLRKFSADLRSGNLAALGNEDITAVKKDMEKILITQGEIGAKVNRLEKGIDRLGGMKINVTSLLSDVEDVDYTQAVMDMKVQEMAYLAALQISGKILPKTLLDYL